MNKQEMVNKLAEKLGVTKKYAKEVYEVFLEVLVEGLVETERVQLTGFGTFEVKQRAERQGHNPQTGEPMTIPARKAPVFKASGILKQTIN